MNKTNQRLITVILALIAIAVVPAAFNFTAKQFGYNDKSGFGGRTPAIEALYHSVTKFAAHPIDNTWNAIFGQPKVRGGWENAPVVRGPRQDTLLLPSEMKLPSDEQRQSSQFDPDAYLAATAPPASTPDNRLIPSHMDKKTGYYVPVHRVGTPERYFILTHKDENGYIVPGHYLNN